MLAVKEILFTLVKKNFQIHNGYNKLHLFIKNLSMLFLAICKKCFTVHLEYIVKLLERFPSSVNIYKLRNLPKVMWCQ